MELSILFCIHCGRKSLYDPAEPPRFCSYCGKSIIIPIEGAVFPPESNKPFDASADSRSAAAEKTVASSLEDSSADSQSASKNTKNPNPSSTSPCDNNGFMEFSPEEYSGAGSNTDFIDQHNERVMTGWLPEDYIASADREENEGDMDFPFALWAKAMHPSGREWFCRRLKRIKINKNDKNRQVSFLPFDEYLDAKAASLLDSPSHRLILRVPAPIQEMEQIRKTQEKRKQDLLELSKGDFLQCFVQGEYSALGGKLYEANAGGKTKYLFLYTHILADEYGFFNKQLFFSRQQIENNARTVQQLVSDPFGGAFGGFFGGLFGRQQPEEKEPMLPQIDTDPNTPFGMHRTVGLSPNYIIWDIVTYAGFLTDTLPDRDGICDFLRFVYSLKTSPEMQNTINRFQKQAANQNIMLQQRMADIMRK